MRNSHNQRLQRASVDDDDDDVAAPAIVIFKIISIRIESNNMLLVMWTRLRECVRACDITYSKRDVCCEAANKMAKQCK